MRYRFILFFVSLALLVSCEREIDIEVNSIAPKFVVEAYINNIDPRYTYVILGTSTDYFSPNFQSIPVRGATVSITEGTLQTNGSINWNTAAKVNLLEVTGQGIPQALNGGIYIDPRVATNPNQALLGVTGNYYRLDIQHQGNAYSGITSMVNPVTLDSVNYGFPYLDSTVTKVRITSHYKDPDSLGNTLFYYWRKNENKNNFGWAGLFKSRAPGRDDVTNGEYIRLTHPQGFDYNDTVTYMLTSVDRNTHKFWDSYNNARNNNGPFATPVVFESYITGPNAVGCFMGLNVRQKTIILKP